MKRIFSLIAILLILPVIASAQENRACSQADTNNDDAVDIVELSRYISKWKSTEIDISELIIAISEWTYGCPVQPQMNWVTPNVHSASDSSELFSSEDQWQTVLEGCDVMGFGIDQVKNGPDATVYPNLDKAIPLLKKHGVLIGIEAGGILGFGPCDDSEGEWSAAFELNKIQPIYDNGGKVSYIAMDGPISRTIEGGRNNPKTGLPSNCGFGLDKSIEELIDYMKAVHAVHPDIKLGLITNFPNWHYGDYPSYHGHFVDYGDYEVVLDTVVEAVEASGEKLYFVHADNPYDFYTGSFDSAFHPDPTMIDWAQRLLDLEEQVNGLGLDFGLIYNSYTASTISDEIYYQDTIEYINAYEQAGGNPATMIIESWYDAPSVLLPEFQPYSFMYTARDALNRPESSNKGDLWFGPNTRETTPDWKDLFTQPESWEEARESISAVAVSDLNLLPYADEVSDEELTSMINALKSWDIGFTIEAGAVKPWGCYADITSSTTFQAIDRIYDLDGSVEYLVMDEPLVQMRDKPLGCGMSMDEIAKETGLYMNEIKTYYPDMKIGEAEPWPHFRQETIQDWIDQLIAESKPDFFVLDINYAQVIRDDIIPIDEVAAIADYVRSRGIPFYMFIWNSGSIYPQQVVDDETQYEATLKFASIIHDVTTFDGVIFESWDTFPITTLPETADYSLTRLLRDYALIYPPALRTYPKTTRRLPRNKGPIGYFDGITNDGLAGGWAYDLDESPVSIDVSFYVDGTKETGTLVDTISSDIYRERLNIIHDITGNHGFLWEIPENYRDEYHEWYAYGIDASDGSSSMLQNSPQEHPVAPPAPTGLQSQCNGALATFTWNPAFNALSYAIRVNDVTNDDSSCTEGWLCPDSTDSYDNDAVSGHTATIIPGHLYSWWVHSVNDVGFGIGASSGFTCQ